MNTTNNAFAKMINVRSIDKSIGLTSQTVRCYRLQIKNNQWPTIDKMEELLMKAGWTVAQEKIWNKPK